MMAASGLASGVLLTMAWVLVVVQSGEDVHEVSRERTQ